MEKETTTHRILYSFLVNEEHELKVFAENPVEAVNSVGNFLNVRIVSASFEIVCFENEIINN